MLATRCRLDRLVFSTSTRSITHSMVLWMAVVALGLPMTSSAEPDGATTVRLQGQVADVSPSGTLSLDAYDAASLDYKPWRQVPLDDAGRFEIQVPWSQPDLWRLSVGGLRAHLVVDGPEDVTVSLRPRKQGGAVIQGSSGNDRLRAFGELLDQRNRHYFDDLKTQGEAAVAAGEADALVSMEDERDRRLEMFVADLGAGLDAMGDSAAVLSALRYMDIYKQRRLFVAALQQAETRRPDGTVAHALRRQLELAATADAGAVAPTFRLQDREGRSVALADHLGNWVFVDFWASWCLNCRLEMPRVAEVHGDFSQAGFTWIGVTPLDTRDAWLAALDQLDVPGHHLWDEGNRVAERYRVGGQLPATFLIDPQGRIVARDLNASELRHELLARMAESKNEHARPLE